MAVTWTVTDLNPGPPMAIEGGPGTQSPVLTSTGTYPAGTTANTSGSPWVCRLLRLTATGAHSSGGDLAVGSGLLNGMTMRQAVSGACRAAAGATAYSTEVTLLFGGMSIGLGESAGAGNVLATTHTDTVTDYTVDVLVFGPSAE